MFLAKKENSVNALVNGIIVAKHGSHDQKTHGRKGGKGTVNPFTNEPSDNPNAVNPFTGETREDMGDRLATSFINDSKSVIRQLEDASSRSDTATSKKLDGAKKDIETAVSNFREAKNLSGSKKISKLQSGMNSYDRAQNKLASIASSNSGESKIADDLGQRLLESIDTDLAEKLELDFYNP